LCKPHQRLLCEELQPPPAPQPPVRPASHTPTLSGQAQRKVEQNASAMISHTHTHILTHTHTHPHTHTNTPHTHNTTHEEAYLTLDYVNISEQQRGARRRSGDM